MCDMRPPPKIATILETKEIISLPYIKHLPGYSEEISEPGIYSVGMSGCGYSYFDGLDWFSCYSGTKMNPNSQFIPDEDSSTKYEFHFKENIL